VPGLKYTPDVKHCNRAAHWRVPSGLVFVTCAAYYAVGTQKKSRPNFPRSERLLSPSCTRGLDIQRKDTLKEDPRPFDTEPSSVRRVVAGCKKAKALLGQVA